MKKRLLLRNLRKAAEWCAAKKRDHNQAMNIMTGCFSILWQAGQRGIGDWLDRKQHRRRILGDIRETYLTKQGNKVLRDLLALNISAVEACAWVDDWWVGALPTPVLPRGPISAEHQTKLQDGRKKRKDRDEAARKRRFDEKIGKEPGPSCDDEGNGSDPSYDGGKDPLFPED